MTLNFQARFVEQIKSGEKRSTIRAPRKDGRVPKPGETLSLFTGMRTKNCQRITEVRCVAVHRIELKGGCATAVDSLVVLDGRRLAAHEADWYAKRDGFKELWAMRVWFEETHGLPFTGTLIEW